MIQSRILTKCSKQLKQIKRTLLSEVGGNSKPTITAKEARKSLKEIVGSSKTWSTSAARDPSITKMATATSQSDLPSKKMRDSYREILIPIGSNPKVQSKYVNFYDSIRVGRILEDLDTMAVLISYTHAASPDVQKSPLSIVTATVDRLDTNTKSLVFDKDIRVRGHVTWVGSSSIEVTMEVDQEHNEGAWENVINSKFLMVARDPKNKGKAFINPLTIETEEEKKLFQEGEASKVLRTQQAQESLLKVAPSDTERQVIHDLFLQTLDPKAATFKHRVKPSYSTWMDEALLKNIVICFPEERNLYNKIFGGFLMRQAFELGWANACVYSKQRPFVIGIDDILFRKPVEIGSLLYLSSQVVYTKGTCLQVKVHAEVVDPKSGGHVTTNIFHITFETGEPVSTVIPRTYAEFMMYLDGKRHFDLTHPNCE